MILTDIKRAALMPFRRPVAAIKVGLCLLALPLLALLGDGIMHLRLEAALGPSFFDPSSGGDPLLLQHVLWVLGHPETFVFLETVSVLALGPLAFVIWCKALRQTPTRGASILVAPWIWLGLTPYLLPLALFLVWPEASETLHMAFVRMSDIAAIFFFFALRRRIGKSLGLTWTAFQFPRLVGYVASTFVLWLLVVLVAAALSTGLAFFYQIAFCYACVVLMTLLIGPEGGDGGGEIVATGTPEQVAEVERSHTGRYLKPMLAPKKHAAE